MLNKKKIAGRVPLENVSEEKTKWTHAVRTTAPNFRNYQIVKKNEPPRRKITLKINKWTLLKATACNKMKTTTYPYHVVLDPKTTKHKKGRRKWDKLPR
jgi:hypothetical protein